MSTLILNPNPVFDRTIGIVEMVPGAVIRTLSVEVTAGGKGINVARVLRALGEPAPLLIPVGADDRERYESLLRHEGASFTTTEVPGGVRTASIYLEQASNRVTVVNDAGTPMAEADWSRVRSAARDLIGRGDVLLCMGSFPPGLSPEALGALIDDVHEAGAEILLDTAPQFLAAALRHGPDLVTPNLDEAEATLAAATSHVMDTEELTHDATRTRAEIAALDLCEAGARRALVTAGSAGIAMAHAGAVTWIPAFVIDSVSTVGAGDSFVAGLAHTWTTAAAGGEGIDWRRAVVFGAAAAAASCEQVRAGGVSPDRIDELLASLPSSPSALSSDARRELASTTGATP